MYFQQFLDDRNGCASYLVASRRTREAVVVDPALDPAPYEALLAARGYALRYVVDTHVHADHVSGARRLATLHGAALCLHRDAPVRYRFRALDDGEDLPLGPLRLRVVHTPGHRPEAISLLVTNPARGPEPSLVLTGDSLLAGDVGRPDFGAGASAGDQFESVARLLRLPDWVAVFPGHFEGPCGKGMCGRPSTTIGFERRFNPIAGLDREAFVASVLRDLPARPLNMTAIYATNVGAQDRPWAMLTTDGAAPEVTPEALDGRPPDAVVVDVREPDEYGTGHVPGARNLPQADLASRLDELPRDRPLLLVCQTGVRSMRAARFLAQAGYPRVASVRGGTAAWIAAGGALAR